MDKVHAAYPWVKTPVVASAPMRLISGHELACAVSLAGGIGFIGAGTDTSTLAKEVEAAASTLSAQSPLPVRPSPSQTDDTRPMLPIGIGFIIWALSPPTIADLLRSLPHRAAALWLFAPVQSSDLREWATALRAASPGSEIWIQVGSVRDAVDAVRHAVPEVLVVQGADAGGHGLVRGAGLVPLLAEVRRAVKLEGWNGTVFAAGGIADGETAAAAVAMGAKGVVLGTRMLAAREAVMADGYRAAVLSASDGGSSTVRSKVYDTLRGTTGWPEGYDGRGVVNESYTDWISGRVDVEENKRLYAMAVEQGDQGWAEGKARMTTYAGTAVGLVNDVMPAAKVVDEVREGCVAAITRVAEEVAGGRR